MAIKDIYDAIMDFDETRVADLVNAEIAAGTDVQVGSVRLNLQDVKTPMAGILRPSVHTTRPGRLRGSA